MLPKWGKGDIINFIWDLIAKKTGIFYGPDIGWKGFVKLIAGVFVFPVSQKESSN